nr:MAG TPA: H-type lectin domain [Caudoviricetes sp.]
MNIEVSAYGLGGGSGGSGGGSYDDTAVKQELTRIKQALASLPSGAPYNDAEIKKELEAVKRQLENLPKGGAVYDDSDLRKQLANVVARVDEIADTRKEYQAAYIARADFITNPANNEFMTVKFKKPFSKKPFVKVTLDLVTAQARISYQGNATETGFDIATNYAGALFGLWYEAHLVD